MTAICGYAASNPAVSIGLNCYQTMYEPKIFARKTNSKFAVSDMVILQSQKMDTRKIKVARIKTKLILKPDGFETEVRCLFVRFVCKTRYSDSLRARKRYRSLYKFNRLICDFYITTTVY